MKKKLVLLFITALLGLMVFTACGSSENAEQTKNNAVNEDLQEEIPAIDSSTQDDTEDIAEVTPTSTPTPSPAPAVQVGRLLLGLSEHMKEYGTVEMDMGITAEINLTDDEIEMLESNEYFEGIEIGNKIEFAVAGVFAGSKTAASIDLDVDINEFGAAMHQDIEQYLQTSESGELINYFFDASTGMWYAYNEGETTPPDLTDNAQSIGIIDTRQLATQTVYQEIEMTEDMDKYLVDGVISFERFRMFAEIANIFNQEIMNTLPKDMEIKVHMEFEKETLAISVLSIYLDNIRPLTQNDRAQFTELYIDMEFDITPNGANIVIPPYILDSAVNAN